MTKTPAEKPAPLHHGHRDRVRARFLKAGPEGVADYELLEILLFAAIPRRDVKPLAKMLIAHFGTLGRVFSASVHELASVKGMTDNTAVLIKSVQAAAQMMLKEQMTERPVLNSW